MENYLNTNPYHYSQHDKGVFMNNMIKSSNEQKDNSVSNLIHISSMAEKVMMERYNVHLKQFINSLCPLLTAIAITPIYDQKNNWNAMNRVLKNAISE